MRIAFISYPMLFQRVGGLQIQVLETLAGLRKCGVDAELFDWRSGRLADYDVIHVFGTINGNHRIVEAAKNEARKVVLSSVMGPPFSRREAMLARIGERVVGRLTGWQVNTSYTQVQAALKGAERIVTLGKAEADMLRVSYDVPFEKLSIIPNGISHRFFDTDPALFEAKYDIQHPWVACVASVSPYKNQLSLVRALAGSGIQVVLAGPVMNDNEEYLRRCTETSGQVTYVGLIDYNDALLPSLYAAADAYVLPSLSEVMPLGVLESLAADTPSVVTWNHSLDLQEKPGILRFVDPNDTSAILTAVKDQIALGPSQKGKRADYVRQLSWDTVAQQILGIYEEVLA